MSWLVHWIDSAVNEMFCGVHWEVAFETEFNDWLLSEVVE